MDNQKMDKSTKKEKKPRHRALVKANKKAEKAVHKLSIKMNPKQFLEFIKRQQDNDTGIMAKVPPKVLLAGRDIEDWIFYKTSGRDGDCYTEASLGRI